MSEGSTCEYCGHIAQWCETIYEITVEWTCKECGATLINSYDHDSHFLNDWKPEETARFCYVCNDLTTFVPSILSFKKKINPEEFLEEAYNEELSKSLKKKKRKEKKANNDWE